MAHSSRFVRWFEEIGIDDVPLVGGKNASLGEMYRELSAAGVRVPNGFAITADGVSIAASRDGSRTTGFVRCSAASIPGTSRIFAGGANRCATRSSPNTSPRRSKRRSPPPTSA